MVLKVIDTVKGETSLISIKVFESHDNELEFYIWDMSGDCATITVSVPSEIKKCVDDLYNAGKATIRGTLTWDEEWYMFGFKKKENNLDKEYFEIERYCPVCHKTHIQKLYNPEKLKTADRYLDGCYKISAEDYTSAFDLCPHCGFLMYKDRIDDEYYICSTYKNPNEHFLKHISISQSKEYQEIFHSENISYCDKKMKLYEMFAKNKFVFEYFITYSKNTSIRENYIKEYIKQIENLGFFAKIYSHTLCFETNRIIAMDKTLVLVDLYRQINEFNISKKIIETYKYRNTTEFELENKFRDFELDLINKKITQHL